MTPRDIRIGNRRLLKLASFLKKLPRERFDYSCWVRTNWKGKPDFSCGTKACAMGWATTIPAFRRLGLYMYYLGEDAGGRIRLKRKGQRDIYGGFDSAGALFHLNNDDAVFLFSATTTNEFKATPKQVARKLEKFVAKREKELKKKKKAPVAAAA